MSFSENVLRNTNRWAKVFAEEWRSETPIKIHSGKIAPDGSPEWHPDFVRWMSLSESERRSTPQPRRRYRTSAVMRRLRKTAPREYEVAYRVLYLGERLEETCQWLNERAKSHAIPFPDHRPEGPHYTLKDAVALFIAAVSYVEQHW